MKKVVSIIAVALFALVLSGGCSQRQAGPTEGKIIMKVATATSNDPQALALEKFKEVVEKNTNGRIQVQTYPACQLGNNEQMHQQLLGGAIQAQFEPTAYMGGFADLLTIANLPYLFKDKWQAAEILNGPAGDGLRNYMEEKGIVVARFYPYGYHEVLAKRPIVKMEDFNGMKIRTGAKVLQDMFGAWGASGVPMGLAELYTALQQGTVDGMETAVQVLEAGKYYEVAKYLLAEPSSVMLSVCNINKRWLESLPDGLGNVVLESAKEIEPWYDNACREAERRALEKMKNAGVQVIEASPELHAKMKAASEQVHQKFLKDNPDAIPIYEKLKKAVSET